MSHKIKYVLSVIIFLLGFIFYMGYMIIWQDNHTIYTLKQCNDRQQEVVQQELGIAFPKSTVIDEITYYWTWGNDTQRTYDMEMRMDANDYKEFSALFSDGVYALNGAGMNDGRYATIKDIKQDDKLCFIKMIYASEGHTSFASWMEENGKENTGYKRIVAALLFLCLILISLLPVIPYKKIFKSL